MAVLVVMVLLRVGAVARVGLVVRVVSSCDYILGGTAGVGLCVH